jgi:hypothetical protein
VRIRLGGLPEMSVSSRQAPRLRPLTVPSSGRPNVCRFGVAFRVADYAGVLVVLTSPMRMVRSSPTVEVT